MADELAPRRALVRHGLGYRYHIGQHHLVMDFSHIKGGDDPSAEVSVTANLPGMPMHQHRSRIHLLGTRSRPDLARALLERTKLLDKEQWLNIVESACEDVLRSMRSGAEIEYAEEADGPANTSWLVESLLMEGKSNALYGPGGKGKGWLAIAMAICVQTGTPMAGLATQQGNVLYYDYEDDKQTFDQRVTMVCRGWRRPVPRIAYRHGGERLDTQIEWLAGFCTDATIRLLIVDSFTFAAGMNSERGGYEESAVRLMSAIRLLEGVTVLFIDHVTGDGTRADGLVGKQYGSVMKQNLIRNNLEVKQDQRPGDTRWEIGVYQTKANHGARLRSIGFGMDFGKVPGALCIGRVSVPDNPVLSVGNSIGERAAHELRHGAMTITALAKSLEVKRDSLKVALKREERFVKVTEVGSGSSDGDTWGLRA